MDDLSQFYTQDPDNFETLYELTTRSFQEHNFPVSFAMSERAIAVFEKHPEASYHARYFDVKRLHYQMIHEHLDEILGTAYPLLDSRWMPVFKLGKVREMAWRIDHTNVLNIRQALNASSLKRLRFLSVTFEEIPDNALIQLIHCNLTSLRALSMHFVTMPSVELLMDFFSSLRENGIELNTFGLRMASIDDALAIHIRRSLGGIDVLSFTSMVREGMTHKLCESIADDPQSNTLTRLCLVGTSMGNEGLFSLMSSENLKSLQALDLHDGILTNAAAHIITASHELPSLHCIDVRYNQIDPAGVDILSRCAFQCYCDNQHERPEGRESRERQ